MAEEPEVPPEFECSICMKLLLDPVSVPCGHTFCRACLEQSLGYRGQCAVCRAPVAAGQGVNILIKGIIAERFPDALAARQREVQEELEANGRAAEEARRREVGGDNAAEGMGNPQAPVLPLLRRADLLLPYSYIEVQLHTPAEVQLLQHALRGGRRIAIIEASDAGGAFDDAARPMGLCVEVEDVDNSRNLDRPVVRLRGKFRFWLAEPPEVHEEGFELGRCEAFFDDPLQAEELVLPPASEHVVPEASVEDERGSSSAASAARATLQLVERQLEHIGQGGRHTFFRRFGEVPPLRGGGANSVLLEQISFWLLGAIISDDAYRRRWLGAVDTKGRIEACHERMKAAGSRPVLDLPGSRSIMHPGQSALTNLGLLIVIIALLVAKAMGVFDQRGHGRNHPGMERDGQLLDAVNVLNLLR